MDAQVIADITEDDWLFVEVMATYLVGLLPYCMSRVFGLKLTRISSTAVILWAIVYAVAYSTTLSFNLFLSFLLLHSFFRSRSNQKAGFPAFSIKAFF